MAKSDQTVDDDVAEGPDELEKNEEPSIRPAPNPDRQKPRPKPLRETVDRVVSVAKADLSEAASTMEEFNKLLWQIARSLFIIVAMLTGISFVVLSYYAARFLATL